MSWSYLAKSSALFSVRFAVAIRLALVRRGFMDLLKNTKFQSSSFQIHPEKKREKGKHLILIYNFYTKCNYYHQILSDHLIN